MSDGKSAARSPASAPPLSALRSKLVERLKEAIEGGTPTPMANTHAVEIEAKINVAFTGKDYTAKGRSLIFNLCAHATPLSPWPLARALLTSTQRDDHSSC